MRDRSYYVYILTNPTQTVFYVGVTGDLVKRVFEHKMKMVDGFTKKYNLQKLVYFEQANEVLSAIEREKQIKGWGRTKKIALIVAMNPSWRDLAQDF